VPASLARFAATHGDWSAPDRTTDDLLVSLADKIWKGHRIASLEDLVTDRLAAATKVSRWEAL
jgi:hypothetical protein